MKKTSLLKKVAAMVSAVALAVTMVPFVGGTKEVKAADETAKSAKTNFVNASDLETVAAGTSSGLNNKTIGTNNYFKILDSSGKTKIDGNNKSIDGYSFTKRISTGATATSTTGCIEFTTNSYSIVTVYGMSSKGGNSRILNIYDSSFEIAAAGIANDGNAIQKNTYVLPNSGTYKIGVNTSGYSIYYISVTETYEEFFAQEAKVGDNYSVRFVYPIAATVNEGAVTFTNGNYESLGVSCTSNNKDQVLEGTDVFSSVKSGATTVTKDGYVYVVIEITEVPKNTTFTVKPVAKVNGTYTDLGSTYTYTTPNK